jgi:hypothetical protein
MATFYTLSYTPNSLLSEHFTVGFTDSVVRKVLDEIKFIYVLFTN